MLILQSRQYEIVIDQDNLYTPRSADNVRAYTFEYRLDDEHYWPSSQHSVTVKEGTNIVRSCILLASGGASGVHEHSALIRGDFCVVAVGPFMCSLHLPSLEVEWKAEVDSVTCFGVYHSEKHHCFISHGEMTISRVDYEGRVVWQEGGADIFTNGFQLRDDYIEVIDFNDKRYRMKIAQEAR